MNEKTKHSLFGASQMSRWSNCVGSIPLIQHLKEQMGDDFPTQADTYYAGEGTKAHSWAELVVGHHFFNPKKPPKRPDWLTSEIEEAVQIYSKYVQELGLKPSDVHVEAKVDLKEFHPELYGTADFVGYDPDNKILHVVDYKHGAGVIVEAKRNQQLQYYAAAARNTLFKDAKIENIRMAIVQPRGKAGMPVTTWQISPWELDKFVEYMQATILDVETTLAYDRLKTGTHCQFCPAKLHCPAQQKNALKAAAEVFAKEEAPKGTTADDSLFPTMEITQCLAILPMVKLWVKIVDEEATRLANAKLPPKGYEVVPSRGVRKWYKDPFEILEELEMLTGVSKEQMMEKPKALSPAACEKALKAALKGKPDLKEALAIMSQYAPKMISNMKLVPIGDTKEVASQAVEAFKQHNVLT